MNWLDRLVGDAADEAGTEVNAGSGDKRTSAYLDGFNEQVISGYAKDMMTGDTAPHLEDV